MEKVYFENLDESARWFKINTVMKIFFRNIKNSNFFNIDDEKYDEIIEEISNYGLETNKEEIKDIINELIEKGILIAKDNKIYLRDNNEEFLREISIKFCLYEYIKEEIEKAIENGNLKNLISSYNKILEKYKFIPTEARYPILKTIALLDNEKIEKIKEVIDIENPLELAIYIMLNDKFEEKLKKYKEKFLKNLNDRNYYYVCAEFSVLAGGLGRVGQYLLPFIKSFGINTTVIEPYYRYDIHGNEVDYEKIPTYVKFSSNKPEKIYEIYVHKRKVRVFAYKGINYNGIDVWLVRDEDWFYTKQIYKYEYNNENFPTIFQFTEFFSKAALELIEELEKEKKEICEKEGKEYKDAIIHCNDGQTSLLGLFKELYYKNSVIENAYIHFTTHTYINRIKNFDINALYSMEIPEDYFYLFLRKENNREIFDLSSCGIRTSSCSNAVSAVHRENILNFDPLCEIYGITNGNFTEFSNKYFIEIFKNLYPKENFENLDEEKILKIKRKAKENLSLDPEKIVISYSGRFVEEKNGRKRAFVNENIERWIKEGAQIVIYGNFMQEKDKKEFEILSEKFNGNFIFKDKFDIDDQRKLLAATDLQIHDSDYRTEAAGYTEADISSCAGLEMAPPYLEGILQQQGIILNRKIVEGNTIIPKYPSSESYRESVLWIIRKYNESKNIIAKYQLISFKIAKILKSAITAMDYLNLFNDNVIKERRKIEKRKFDKNIKRNEVEIEDFSISYCLFSKNFKIYVYINPNNVDKKFVNVYLAFRNYNEILKIPFKFLKEDNGKFLYELNIDENLKNLIPKSPLVKCEIIATSGLWNNIREIFLINL
ncbi:MAG: glycogen/starch synthase [Candidatus Altarchaeaceae archaeon]